MGPCTHTNTDLTWWAQLVSQTGGSGCSAICRHDGARHAFLQTAWCEAYCWHPCIGWALYKRCMQHPHRSGVHEGSARWCGWVCGLWRELEQRTIIIMLLSFKALSPLLKRYVCMWMHLIKLKGISTLVTTLVKCSRFYKLIFISLQTHFTIFFCGTQN